jgi:HSP20 family protein
LTHHARGENIREIIQRGIENMEKKPTAVQRSEEPTALKPVKYESLLEHIDDIFATLSSRAFEIFSWNGGRFGHDLEHWFQAERELLHPVHVQLNETGESFEVKAEVPGFSEKELEISVEPRRLTITGKRETSKEEKKGKTLYSEKCSDRVLRIVELPAEVQTDKVVATLKNGVLEFNLPKVAKAQPIRIQPKAA